MSTNTRWITTILFWAGMAVFVWASIDMVGWYRIMRLF